jgi:hypothetical protein
VKYQIKEEHHRSKKAKVLIIYERAVAETVMKTEKWYVFTRHCVCGISK